MSAPGSRLSDDLYSLYLAGIAWLLLPVYGNGLAVVLPSDFGGFARTLDLLAAGAIVSAAWIGYRGGPFLVNRAGVIHELGSPRSRRSSMLPRLLRQGVAYAALAAIAVTVLLAMSDAESFGFAEAGKTSVVAIAAMLIAVAQAECWLIVWKGDHPPRPAIIASNVVVAGGIVALVAFGQSLETWIGALALAAGLAVSGTAAIVLLERVPVDHLWKRASALEDMRSAMLSFDFQQVLVNLRRAVDHSEGRRVRVRLARRWMPLQLWRYLASIEHGIVARLGQFAVSGLAIAAFLVFADPADGVVALAIAGIGFVVGIELSAPVASTAGQSVFVVHYPRTSIPILRRQVATATVLAAVLASASMGWKIAIDPTVGLAILGLLAFGTLAASAQGRLGSPDVAQMASILGPSGIGPALWARALLGPLLTLGLTIVVSHGWLHPDPSRGPWPSLVLVLVVIAAVVATYPMEKRSA